MLNSFDFGYQLLNFTIPQFQIEISSKTKLLKNYNFLKKREKHFSLIPLKK